MTEATWTLTTEGVPDVPVISRAIGELAEYTELAKVVVIAVFELQTKAEPNTAVPVVLGVDSWRRSKLMLAVPWSVEQLTRTICPEFCSLCSYSAESPTEGE